MTKLIDRVENLLVHGYKTASPQKLRDSDKTLLLAIWEQEGLYLTAEQKAVFMAGSTAESVTRARRALKAQYPASEKVDQVRYQKFLGYKYDKVMYI